MEFIRRRIRGRTAHVNFCFGVVISITVQVSGCFGIVIVVSSNVALNGAYLSVLFLGGDSCVWVFVVPRRLNNDFVFKDQRSFATCVCGQDNEHHLLPKAFVRFAVCFRLSVQAVACVNAQFNRGAFVLFGGTLYRYQGDGRRGRRNVGGFLRLFF